MHYRLSLYVELGEPAEVPIEADVHSFESYRIALGANANSASEALALAERFVAAQHEVEGCQLLEAEVELIPEDQVPTSVLSDAFSPPSEHGIYWASGRIFA